MRSNPFWRKEFVLPALAATALVVLVVIVILAANEPEDQVAEATAVLAAQTEATASPEMPTAAAALTDREATDVPTAEVAPAGESGPAEAVASGFAEVEQYVSVTEFFTIMVPVGWSFEETFPGGAMVMANSDAALAHYNAGGALESGDLILNAGFLPFELFRQRELAPLNIQFGAAPDVFMQSVLPVFRAADDVIVGDVALVSLSDERDAGIVNVSGEQGEGLVLMYMAGDEVVAVVSAVASPGEIDAFRETIKMVAAGVMFRGAQRELYGALLEG